MISTLSVLLGVSMTELSGALAGVFTAQAAVSFLTFVLLYTPCIAAIGAFRRETSALRTLGIVISQCAVAWVAAFGIHSMMLLFA